MSDQDSKDYSLALLSGYILMGLHIVSQILLVPIYLKTLGKAQFGTLMLILAYINYAAFGTGWLNGSSQRLVAEHFSQGKIREFFQVYQTTRWTYLTYSMILAGAALVIGHCASYLGWTSEFFNFFFERPWVFILASCYFILHYEFSAERLMLFAIKEQFKANLMQIASTSFFVLTVIPGLFLKPSIELVFSCYFAGVLFARVITFFVWRGLNLPAVKDLQFTWTDKKRVLKQMAGPMGMGYLAFGMIQLSVQADVILIGMLGGSLMAADFVLVWKIADVASQLVHKVPEYMIPYIMSMDALNDEEKMKRTYSKAWKTVLALSIAAGLSYALLGRFIVQIWVGDQSIPTDPLPYCLAGSMIFFSGMSKLPSIYSFATVRLRALVQVGAIELVSKLILTAALISSMGYLATLSAWNLVHLCGVAILYQKLYPGKRKLEESKATECAE